MLTADLGSTRSLGPIAAIGVFTVMIGSGSRCCRACSRSSAGNGFWPRRRLIAYDPDHEIEERSFFRRFGSGGCGAPSPRCRARPVPRGLCLELLS